MRIAPIRAAILALLSFTALLQAQEKASLGTIIGTVKILGNIAPARRDRGAFYRSGASVEHIVHRESPGSELEMAIVYLQGDNLIRANEESRKKATLDQKNATFLPHVQAIVKGTTILITNHDDTYHSVFSLSPAKRFNIGRRPAGETVPVTFEKCGVVQVFCDIHSHMTAYILVLDNPYFTSPARDGSFILRDVPPGTYTIKAWHERLSESSQKIEVQPGSTASVSLVLE